MTPYHPSGLGPLRPARHQKGFSLIEVLVSLLVFSFGILALVGLQGTAIHFSSDAQDRATATFLADQLLARMLISAHTDPDVFAHHADDATPVCSPTGAASTDPQVVEWLTEVDKSFPNAGAAKQRVVIQKTGTAPNFEANVTITICWKNANESDYHNLVVTNKVQWP